VQTLGVEGYYSNEDLILQMIFYSDITSWRTARLMQVAEECRQAGRSVLVLTENAEVEHLASIGFLVYRPSMHGLNPIADAMAIVARIKAGDSVVVNTTQTELYPRNVMIRHLLNGLAAMDIGNLGLVVENTESFFPRKRSHGDNEGMHTLAMLLRRAKVARIPVAFGAESSQEIAREIGKSCGTPVVGRITNDECMRDISKALDTRIRRYANELYGIKALDPRDFYLYNRYTAPRQAARQMELEIGVSVEALTRGSIVPCWLSDRVLTCGFRPEAPTPGPDLDGEDQSTFVEEIEQARADSEEGREAAVNVQPAPVASATPSNVVRMRTSKTAQASSAPRGRMASGEAVPMVAAAGFLNAGRLVTIGRAVITSRGGRLYAPLDRRLTPRSLAQRIVGDATLREAILAGQAVCLRFMRSTGVVSSRAYASALYQAMQEDLDLARSFHAEMSVEGVRSGRRSARAMDLDTGLRRLGEIKDTMERGEAQYQMIRQAWFAYRTIMSDTVRPAA
jgi:hypothetical protein